MSTVNGCLASQIFTATTSAHSRVAFRPVVTASLNSSTPTPISLIRNEPVFAAPAPIIHPLLSNHQLLRKAVSEVTNEVSKLGQDLETIVELDETILQAECECCGHTEDCTKGYISRVRSSFSGKWVCGLCTEAVKERLRRSWPPVGVEEAVINHKSFVQDFNTTTRLNPKLSLTWAMRDIAKKNCEKRKSLSGGIKIIRTSSCVPRIDYDTN